MRDWLKTNRDIIAICAVAFVLRASLVGWLHEVRGYTGDEKEYIALATTLAEGKPFVDSNGEWATKAPLYPFVISLLFRACGGSLLVPHLLNVALGAIAVVLLFTLCLTIFEERFVALVASAIMALYPGFVIYSAILQTEAMYVVFLLLAFLTIQRIQRQWDVTSSVSLGLYAGITSLTRAVFVGFFPLLLAVLAWLNRGRLRFLGRRIIVAGGVWCLILLPWTWRNYAVFEKVVPVSSWGGMSLLLGNNPHATGTWKPKTGFDEWFAAKARQNGLDLANSTEVQRSELAGKLALEFIAAQPGEALFLAAKKFSMHWIYPITNTDSNTRIQAVAVLADLIVYLFAGIGVIANRTRFRSLIPVFAAIVFFSVLQVVLHCEARYRLPIMPFIAIFSAAGIALFLDTEKRGTFLHIGRNLRFAALWCAGVVAVYAFTAWQFLSGKI